MSLNIKDEQTHELVRELAALKGTTLTGAVKMAVREQLEREKGGLSASDGSQKPRRSEALQAFAREFASRVKPGDTIHSWDINALLYDENGLPK